MKKIKLFSIVLAVIMVLSSLSIFVSAKESEVESTDDYYAYYSNTYATEEDAVKSMTLMYEDDTYRMYVDKPSGMFAIQLKSTGKYIFSNPIDLNENTSINTNLAKNALLSQVLVSYTDTTTGTGAYLSSFGSAAVEGQIEYKTLTNGLRVEYAIGTVETKRLIPMMIEATRFQTLILDVLEEAKSRMTVAEQTIYDKMKNDTYYKYYDQTDPAYETMVDVWRDSYKCLASNHEMKIYVFQGTERVKSLVEKLIRKYCPNYTYDELEYDHELTMYESNQKELPLFRLAVEYTFDESGFSATIPAKSIRYNRTNYSLQNVVLLPYFGCSDTKISGNTSTGQKKVSGGYIFIPDGSGTLLDFYAADGSVNTGSQSSGVIYGVDYTKETLSGSANAEVARIPVFGLVEESTITTTIARTNRPAKTEYTTVSRGFTAVVTEGEAFANIVANLGQMAWDNLATVNGIEYNTVYATFTASQSDTVSSGGNLGSSASMSTTMDTQYTGNYSVCYTILSDEVDKDAAGDDYYESSYIGMANAYRDYLISTGTITKLADSVNESGIPLYVESFGAIKSTSTFLTFPVEVTTPLTTFADVQTMADQFKEGGVNNQRWILTGFANGTMTKTNYPTYLSWTSKLGGATGFKKLLNYAKANNFVVYPNFDFMSVSSYRIGFSMKQNVAKTMSGKYATIRDYDYVTQEYGNAATANVITASALERLYTNFYKKYKNYSVQALAVKTVGNSLNSDFNSNNTLTREEAKLYVVEALAAMKATNETLLVSGGNSYVLPYVTDIIELPLDNSGYSISSESVPFIGMVLHGYMNYAGDAVNMAGDTMYSVLKSLENGAGLYFILSYQNTDLVKTSTISEYYSMMFETWAPEVVEYYNMINDAIGDMQNATIVDHSYVNALRMDSAVAQAIFGQSVKIAEDYVVAEGAYASAVIAVDNLIKSQQDATSAIAVEGTATEVFNKAYTLSGLTEYIMNRYNVGDVVSVTYKNDLGNTKTFYINYNTYDVVAATEDGVVFKIPAESFVSSDEIKSLGTIIEEYTSVTAYTATTKQRATFISAYTQLQAAIADGDETMTARRIVSVKNALSSMTAADNVEATELPDGRTVIVNYNKSAVIVQLSDTDCREISSQSYIVLD